MLISEITLMIVILVQAVTTKRTLLKIKLTQNVTLQKLCQVLIDNIDYINKQEYMLLSMNKYSSW